MGVLHTHVVVVVVQFGVRYNGLWGDSIRWSKGSSRPTHLHLGPLPVPRVSLDRRNGRTDDQTGVTGVSHPRPDREIVTGRPNVGCGGPKERVVCLSPPSVSPVPLPTRNRIRRLGPPMGLRTPSTISPDPGSLSLRGESPPGTICVSESTT